MSEVVTELTIDASGTASGASDFDAAMQKIEVVLEAMLSTLTGATVAWKNYGDQMQLVSVSGNGLTDKVLGTTQATANYAAAATSATTNTSALGGALSDLQGGLSSAAGSLGGMSTILIGLGSGGILAAVIAGYNQLKTIADAQGDSASALVTQANNLHLSVDELQALQEANTAVGVTTTQTDTAIQHFAQQLDSLRQGTGALYQEMARISPALLLQMQTTKSTAVEIQLLAVAYANAGTAADKLIKTALGGNNPSGLAAGMLKSIGAQGMAGTVVDSQQSAAATQEQIQLWGQLKDEIDATKQHASDVFASIFTTELLQSELATAQFFDGFAEATKQFTISGDLKVFIDFFSAQGWPVMAQLTALFQNASGQFSIPSPTQFFQSMNGTNANSSFLSIAPNSPASTAVDFAQSLTATIASKLSFGLQSPQDFQANAQAEGAVIGGLLKDALSPAVSGMESAADAIKTWAVQLLGEAASRVNQSGAQQFDTAGFEGPAPATTTLPTVSPNPLASGDLDAAIKQQTADVDALGKVIDQLNASESNIPLSAAAAYNSFKEIKSALGGAATAAEQLRLENLKLAAANPPLSPDIIQRAMTYKALQIDIASETQLLTAGVGTYAAVLRESDKEPPSTTEKSPSRPENPERPSANRTAQNDCDKLCRAA